MRFLAKQPIMTAGRSTFAYELLFRSGWENRFSGDAEAASCSVVDWAVTHGFQSLVGTALPFVNCTRDLILSHTVELLPRSTVLEILETTQVDDTFLEACKRLRHAGYALALDDYDFHPRWDPYLPLVQYIKVDLQQTSSHDRRALIGRLKHRGIRFIAERVENAEELQMASSEGFDLFQGYFFMKPQITARRGPGKSVHHLKLLAEVCKPDMDLEELFKILRSEPSICYRLLRHVNSASTAIRQPVTELRHAILLIGQTEIRHIIRAAIGAELTAGTCVEAMERCILRARFCELLADSLHLTAEEFYLMGMLSAVLPLMGLLPDEIVTQLPLRPEVIAALTHPEASQQHALTLTLANAYERGDWEQLSQAGQRLGIQEDEIAQKHGAAEEYSHHMIHQM